MNRIHEKSEEVDKNFVKSTLSLLFAVRSLNDAYCKMNSRNFCKHKYFIIFPRNKLQSKLVSRNFFIEIDDGIFVIGFKLTSVTHERFGISDLPFPKMLRSIHSKKTYQLYITYKAKLL